jgi:hypothetical protein
MSTTATTPRLSEVARHLVIPDGIKTTVYNRLKPRLAAMGVAFDRWQEGFSSTALGCRADGRYAATIGGVCASIPRQVGKTYTVGNLLIALCTEFPGTRVVWTSHHNRTTTNTFRAMQAMVRRKKVAVHLAANGIRTANGEQEIRFANGSIIMFGAREHGFGRGMDAVDVLVFDEAQILGIKALEDMVPATNQAHHPHGALVFFIGTPPRPIDEGEAFRAKRRRALSGDAKDMFYVELSADPDAGLDDLDQLAKANPSYPHRTPLEAVLRMRENIPDEGSQRREMFGIWDELESQFWTIPETIWGDLKVDAAEVPTGTPAAYGLDMSHSRNVSIGVCVRGEGRDHVEVAAADRVPGDTAGVVEWLATRCGRRIPVVVDQQSPAASMIPALKARKVRVITTTAPDMAKACGGLYDAALEGRLSHFDQAPLNAALAGAQKRDIGTAGGWGWDRRSPDIDISPLVAVTIAHFGAHVAAKPRTNRVVTA